MSSGTDRFARQADLVPWERLEGLAVTVIGVGAIGRQLALQLAALGVPRLQLIDFDTVEATNISSQGYRTSDLGRPKVAATARAIHEIDPQIAVNTIEDRYRPATQVHPAVGCCVDSITARAAIWRSLERQCHFFADGRMRGEIIRVLVAADPVGRAHYLSTLFPQSEVQRGACTARGVIYTAALAAALITHQLARWLRGLPVDRDLCVNLLAAELSAG